MSIKYISVETKVDPTSIAVNHTKTRVYKNVNGYTLPNTSFPYWTIYQNDSLQAVFFHIDRTYLVKVVEEEDKDGD